MTTTEIYDYMRLRYDTNASQGAPGYDVSDYSTHFNRAQIEFVLSLYDDLNNPKREGAESTELRSKQLVQLKDHSVINTFSIGDHPFSYFVNLPDNTLVSLKEECDIQYQDCGNTIVNRVQVKPVREDYYNANVKNPYKKPYKNLIWRIDRERGNTSLSISSTNNPRHEIILFQGATPTNYRISYYRYPKDVNLNNVNDFCEIHPTFHSIIADRAVLMMMVNTSRDNLQAMMLDNQITPE